jgi:hypothetical protein
VNIGKVIRIYTTEPLKSPVPSVRQASTDDPKTPPSIRRA